MSPVAKVSFSTALFLSLATLFHVADVFPTGTVILGALGTVQILNAMAPRLPFSRFFHWLHALAFESIAVIGVALLRLMPLSSKTEGRKRPILLVHGYMNHSSVWVLQKKRLEALGFGPVYSINLGHPFRSIASYAEKVQAKCEAIAKETGRRDLVLIGHSMGGLVASYYATRLAPPKTVTDVITIASPLAGTPVAHLGIGPNAKEMRPNSPFVKELQAAIAQNRQIRFHHIATKSDQLVIPGASAALTDNQHFVFEDVGHASLLYSRRVTERLAHWLEQAGSLQ